MMTQSKCLINMLFACLVSMPLLYSDENSIDTDPNDCCEAQQDCCEGKGVFSDSCWYYTLPMTDCEFARNNDQIGIWLPEAPPLFRPFIADPRQITYSAGWRFNDHVLNKNIIPVSFADSLALYRWCNIWYFRGDLQIELEGAVWAVFDPLHDSSPLVNADYYVGVPISYSFGNWAIRLRAYHISSHIGDEFLLNHPHFHRKNPSAEYLDLFVSNQFTRDIRLYGGVGWVCCQDDSFRFGSWYVEAGVELRLFEWAYHDYCNRLYIVPIYGMHFRVKSEFKHHIDATYILGVEFGKLSGLRRRMRIFMEYHDGYSLEGQFCKFPTSYFSIRGTYGF